MVEDGYWLFIAAVLPDREVPHDLCGGNHLPAGQALLAPGARHVTGIAFFRLRFLRIGTELEIAEPSHFALLPKALTSSLAIHP